MKNQQKSTSNSREESLLLLALLLLISSLLTPLSTKSQLVITEVCLKKCQHNSSPFTESTDYLTFKNNGKETINLHEWSISNGKKKKTFHFRNSSYSILKPEESATFFLKNTNEPYCLPLKLNEGDHLYLYNKDTLILVVELPAFINSGAYKWNQTSNCFKQPQLQTEPCHPASTDDKQLTGTKLFITTAPHNVSGPLAVLGQTQKSKKAPCCLIFNMNDTLLNSQALISSHSPDGDSQVSIQIDLLASEDHEILSLPIVLLSDNPRTLILRNGGEDGFSKEKSGIRNTVGASIFNSIPASRKQQLPQQIHVYINQNYFGLYWVYEKINENALTDASAVLKRSSKSKNTKKAFKGNWTEYDHAESKLLAIPSSSTEFITAFDSLWDREHYIAYHFFQQFIGNQDRFSNNVKIWKSKNDERWRYLLWDIDWGYGLWDSISPSGTPNWNALAFQLSNNAGWTKQPETKLFQHAMQNIEFKEQFITQSFDYLNFECSALNHKELINQLTNELQSELELQFDLHGSDQTTWRTEIVKISTYINDRFEFHRTHLADHCNDSLVTLELSQFHKDFLLINGHPIPPEDLVYVSKSQLQLLPIVVQGKEFLMWSDSISSISRKVNAGSVIPYPIYKDRIKPPELKITKVNTAICFNGGEEFIEIHNTGSSPVLLNGCTLSDGKNVHTFHQLDSIESNSSLRVTNLDISLNKEGEIIYLKGPEGEILDVWDYCFEAFSSGNQNHLYQAFDEKKIHFLSIETLNWMIHWTFEDVMLFDLRGGEISNISEGNYLMRKGDRLLRLQVYE